MYSKDVLRVFKNILWIISYPYFDIYVLYLVVKIVLQSS